MSLGAFSVNAAVAAITQSIQDALEAVDKTLLIQKQKNHKLSQIERFALDTIYHQLQLGKTKIDTWKTLWIIGSDKSETVYVQLWGEDGRTKISDLLSMISKESSLIVLHARLVVNPPDNPKTVSPRRHSNLKWPRRHSKDDSMKGAKHSEQTADVAALKEHVSGLIDRLSELWKDTELYFRRLHASGVISDLIEFQSIPTALYETLRRQNCPLYLDMQFLNDKESVSRLPRLFESIEASVSFHCIFQSYRSEVKAQHLVFKTIGHRGSSNEGSEAQESDLAAEKLQLSKIKTDSCFSFHLPIHNSTNKHTILAESFPSNMFEEYEAKARFFQSAPTKYIQPLTLRQKFSIANQLAETILILMGTPWLNTFSSESIRYLRIDETQYYLCLYIDPSQTIRPEKTSEFQTIQQQQIFTLGLMLLEIALETPMHKRWKDGEDPGDIWRDYQKRYSRMVESAMGTSYSRACEFCFFETVMEGGTTERDSQFADKGSDALFDLEDLVEGYHTEVFIRLRDIMKQL